MSQEYLDRPQCPHCHSTKMMWKDGIVNNKFRRFKCSECFVRVRINIETGKMSKIIKKTRTATLTEKANLLRLYADYPWISIFVTRTGSYHRSHIRAWIKKTKEEKENDHYALS